MTLSKVDPNIDLSTEDKDDTVVSDVKLLSMTRAFMYFFFTADSCKF